MKNLVVILLCLCLLGCRAASSSKYRLRNPTRDAIRNVLKGTNSYLEAEIRAREHRNNQKLEAAQLALQAYQAGLITKTQLSELLELIANR